MVTIAQVLRELNDAVSDVRINTSKRLWYPLVEDILKKYNLEFNFEITYNGIDIITTDETYRVEDQFCLMDTLLDEDGSFETANQKTLVEAAIMAVNKRLKKLKGEKEGIEKSIERLERNLEALRVLYINTLDI